MKALLPSEKAQQNKSGIFRAGKFMFPSTKTVLFLYSPSLLEFSYKPKIYQQHHGNSKTKIPPLNGGRQGGHALLQDYARTHITAGKYRVQNIRRRVGRQYAETP